MFVNSKATLIQTRIGVGRTSNPEKGPIFIAYDKAPWYWIYRNVKDTLGANTFDKRISSCSSPFLFKPWYFQVPKYRNFEEIRGYIYKNNNRNRKGIQNYGILSSERQTDPIWAPYYG